MYGAQGLQPEQQTEIAAATTTQAIADDKVLCGVVCVSDQIAGATHARQGRSKQGSHDFR
jgi:hypothetical protein